MPRPDLTTGQKAYLLGNRIRPWAGIFLAAVLAGYAAISLLPSKTVEKDKPSLEKIVEQEPVTYKANYNLFVNVPPGQLEYIKAQVRLTEQEIKHKQYGCRMEWIWRAAARNPDGNFRTKGKYKYIYVTKEDVDDIPTLIRKYNQYAQEYHGNK